MRDSYRHCGACGDWHWISAWPDNHRIAPPQRSDLASPSVIRDQMNATRHPLDWRDYDSKQEFRQVTNAKGGIEIGNDNIPDTRYMDTVKFDDVAEAYKKVNAGYVPQTPNWDKVIDGKPD